MAMNRSKKQKRTVLVTGSTGGIGREIALEFAKEGWNVLCHYFSSGEKAEKLKKGIEKYGVDCRLLKADLSKDESISEIISKTKKYRIDSLINNAGSYIASMHFRKLNLNEIKEVFMVNTFAPILIASEIFKTMKNRKFGRIVNISSIAAKYGGSARSMHYGCSKRALEGLTKTLAREGSSYNILVNTIRPGVIDTDFHKKYPKNMKKRIELIPLKRMGLPKDIAKMTYYLVREPL